MTTERIAAAIKPILDEDRRADRERIAELERDRAHYASPDTQKSIADLSQQLRAQLIELDVVHRRNAEKTVTIENLNKQLDELTEKCAALVVERDQLHRQMVSFIEDPAQISTPFGLLPINSAGMRRLIDEFVKVRDLYLGLSAAPHSETAPTLRIDTDMSDPQPGKLLVVRLDADDVGRAWVPLGEMSDRGRETQNFWPEQRVGFLVETPAVEVKRTPKVGDKVRAKLSGRIGVVHKLFGGIALINQGGQMFEVLASEIEVIE